MAVRPRPYFSPQLDGVPPPPGEVSAREGCGAGGQSSVILIVIETRTILAVVIMLWKSAYSVSRLSLPKKAPHSS